MAAALLAPGVTTLRNMPPVLDLDVMSELLRAVGAVVEQPAPNVVRVDASGSLQPEAPYELVSRMRASFNVLGPLLARCGEARVALPGGDNIGSRKVDMHLRGLESMGAEVEVKHGFVYARCDVLQGARVVLEFPSVGATENLMCAAVLAKGTTVIENAAREPEVTDLAAFLDRMGAQVTGAGTATIEIEGVEELVPVDSEIMADRVEAGTLLMACGIGAVRSSSSARGSSTSRSSCRNSAPWACAFRRPLTACGRGATAGCARSTCRRFRTRASRPTSCRSPSC